jgi:hypothetical protein
MLQCCVLVSNRKIPQGVDAGCTGQVVGGMNARCLTIGLLFAFVLSSRSSSGGIKPFTTDGCGMFPEGTAKQKDLWLACGINHDLDYWKGGNSEERLRAD